MSFCKFCKSISKTNLIALQMLALLAALSACNRDAPEPRDEPVLQPLLPFDERPSEDDIIYFVITDRFDNADTGNDRGGIEGNKLDHGFDPQDEKFYHGGDLQGVTKRLDYLADLGVSAIWITPVFRNLPVQTFGEWTTASYHGYWIADFLSVDPHLGSEDDLRDLIAAAHERDIKIILDIVVNHTAHVIKYRECHDPDYAGPGKEGPAGACVYRGTEDFPETAYTPYIDPQDLTAKNPAWLNDPAYYHNRGELDYTDASFYWGDFSGLDDVMTEHPRVVEGMIEIYQYWIREFGIDGFRIDTVGHVNREFWSQFAPAMLEHAAAHGRPEFLMFGEVVDSVLDKRSYIAAGDLPAVLDFDFQYAAVEYVANSGSAADLADFFRDGDYFIDRNSSPYQLPTFLGNHDLGRFGVYINKAEPDADEEIKLKRSILAHALLYFSRGIPILYYGDEQGFMGTPGFHESREDMLASVTPKYNAYDLLGTERTTADENFVQEHPMYRALRKLSTVYREHPALRRGDQINRYADAGPGLFAFSRIDPEQRTEYLVVVNNDSTAASATVPVSTHDAGWVLIAGDASGEAKDQRQFAVTVPPLAYAVYKASHAIPLRESAGNIEFANLKDGDTLRCNAFVEVSSSANLTHIEFGVITENGEPRSLGIDREPPYRAYIDLADYSPESDIELSAKSQAYAPESVKAKLKLHLGTRVEHCNDE